MSSAPQADAATANVRATARESFVVLEPRRGWAALNLRELWAYRELLYYLTWRTFWSVTNRQCWEGGRRCNLSSP